MGLLWCGAGVISPVADIRGVMPELACMISLGCLVFHSLCSCFRLGALLYSHRLGCDALLLVLLFDPPRKLVPFLIRL